MSFALHLACQVLEDLDPKAILRHLSANRKRLLSVGETVISGTGVAQDIMRACLYRLQQLDRAKYDEEMENPDVVDYLENEEPIDEFDPEEYTYEHLFNVMQEYCPPFTYFGNHETDGSIGCWPPDTMAREELDQADQLTWYDDRHAEQSEAIRRGDYTGILTRYVLIEYRGNLELWDSQRHTLLWTY